MRIEASDPRLEMGRRRVTKLGGRWTFRKVGDESWMTAEVPGSNFGDLRRNGLIGDPMWGDNEPKLQWIEKEDWEYRCLFDVSEEDLRSDSLELVFEGLDTLCDVELNGKPLLHANNMFLAYRAECRARLHAGENELRFLFRSPVKWGSERRSIEGFTYPAENDRTEDKASVYVRKAPYHFGWDWGPKFVTSGVWRPITLDATRTARIRDFSHEVLDLGSERATIAFTVEIEGFAKHEAWLEIACPEPGVPPVSMPVSLAKGKTVHIVCVEVERPRLWWPNGLGEAFLYRFTVQLSGAEGPIDSSKTSIGLRTVELVREKDSYGETFLFKVNGQRVFMKGANVIPLDSFYEKVTPDRYRQLFRDAVDANMNMLRVWGGGVYEADLFYELADEHGILIWQDFMFSCTLYPSDPDFLSLVAEEARQVVRRLRGHACIALWCGNNEVSLGIAHWDWPEKFGYSAGLFKQLVNGNEKLFGELLPSIIRELDGNRSYVDSSPIGFWNDPADDGRGDGHYWGVWHGELPFESYEKRLSRFMSEYGFQSYPSLETISRFTDPQDRYLGSKVLEGRQKHPRGNAIIERFVGELYGEPRDFESFCYLSQVLQADGLRVAFEAHRRAKPFCMGSLYWQFNDCWPAISWSSIDYYGQWKALHYQAARSFGPVMLSLEMVNGAYRVHGVSDRPDEVRGRLTLELVSFDGLVLAQREREVSLLSLSGQILDEFATDSFGSCRTTAYLKMRLVGEGEELASNTTLLAPVGEALLPDPRILLEIIDNQGISISAKSFARAVAISAEPADADSLPIIFEDNFFDLGAGETRVIKVRGERAFDPRSVKVRSMVDAIEARHVEIAAPGTNARRAL